MTIKSPQRVVLSVSSPLARPPNYMLTADLRKPIDGEVKACITVRLHAHGIAVTPDDVNVVVSGSKDLCESKRYHVFAGMPCLECRSKFLIEPIA